MSRTLSLIKLDFEKIKIHFADKVFRIPSFTAFLKDSIYHSNHNERFLLSFEEIEKKICNYEFDNLNVVEWSILYYNINYEERFKHGFEKIYSFNSTSSSTIAKQEYLNHFDPFDKETSLTSDNLITFGEFKIFIKWLCTLTATFNSEIYGNAIPKQFLQSNTFFLEKAQLRYNFEINKRKIIERIKNDDYSELHNFYAENQEIFDYIGHQDINGDYFCPSFIRHFYSLIELNAKISPINGEFYSYESGRILILDSY